jgi:RNA 2',3'-cyclic 3'-phosphodiesterase
VLSQEGHASLAILGRQKRPGPGMTHSLHCVLGVGGTCEAAEVRLFAAILIPPEVAAHLDAAVAPHRDDALRWTTMDSWHLTLAFYGQVDDTRVPDLKRRLTRAAKKYPKLSLTLAGAGRFSQRALWTGFQGDLVPLRALARSVAAAGQRAGASEEQNRFKAHLTLARAPKPTDLRPYASNLADYRGLTWTADAVALIRSHLGAGENRRARYETLSLHQLSGAADSAG